MAADLRKMRDEDPDARQGHRRRQGPRGPAPPGRHPRRRGGDHQGAAHRATCRSSASPRPGQDPEDAPVVTQYEMHGVEDLGLLKMDFLGLRNLDVITDTLEIIQEFRGRRPRHRRHPARRRADLRAAPAGRLDRRVPARGRPDAGAHALAGADQLRGRRRPRRPVPARADGREHAQRLRRPEERPEAGRVLPPRRRGGAGRHLRPDDLPGVGDAGGAEVRRLLAGRGRQPAQGLRQEDPRAHGARSGRSSSPACEATGYGATLGTELFDIIEPFADYAFAKSHSYGYGLIAYQTAYLKAHYPVEYLAALLTSVKANLDKAAVYLAECRTMGIEVLVPDVNRSVVRLRAAARLDDGAGGRSCSACPRCATSARASSA